MKKNVIKKVCIVLSLAMMTIGMSAAAFASEEDNDFDLPEEYTKVKEFEGTYGFGDAQLTVATNEEENIFYITFICFDEDQVLEGTVDDGIVTVDYDLSGFVSGDAQFMWDDAVASDAEWISVGEPDYDLPEGYTKVKEFEGTYGFGDAQLTVATNEEENIFYITFICFDEDQVLEGTVDDGIVTVDYDLSGFVSGDAQFMWDDAVASDAEWVSVKKKAAASDYDLPEGYTKVKEFEGTYGFGDAQLTVATNEEENIFYITFICFDEDQVLEGTVDDGIVTVDYDLSGFVSGDAQFMWDDAVASDAEWVSVQ